MQLAVVWYAWCNAYWRLFADGDEICEMARKRGINIERGYRGWDEICEMVRKTGISIERGCREGNLAGSCCRRWGRRRCMQGGTDQIGSDADIII